MLSGQRYIACAHPDAYLSPFIKAKVISTCPVLELPLCRSLQRLLQLLPLVSLG